MRPIIIKHTNVRLEPGSAPLAPAPGYDQQGAHERRSAQTARLLERDGVVHAIELRCACGRATVVQLDYPDTPPAH